MKKEPESPKPPDGNKTAFQRFEKLAKKVVSASKKELKQKPQT